MGEKLDEKVVRKVKRRKRSVREERGRRRLRQEKSIGRKEGSRREKLREISDKERGKDRRIGAIGKKFGEEW